MPWSGLFLKNNLRCHMLLYLQKLSVVIKSPRLKSLLYNTVYQATRFKVPATDMD